VLRQGPWAIVELSIEAKRSNVEWGMRGIDRTGGIWERTDKVREVSQAPSPKDALHAHQEQKREKKVQGKKKQRRAGLPSDPGSIKRCRQ